MNKEYIIVKGVRENNLRDVSLQIPKHKITVVTGVSGSGKSSLVFDTLASEAQRLLYDNFSMFVRHFLPRYSQPDTNGIENLPMAIVIDQKRIGGGSRSTVGTITDIYTVLRMLYSRVGTPFVGYSNSFSFNDPAGACPTCGGSGVAVMADVEAIIDRTKSLSEGAIRFPVFSAGSLYGDSYIYSGVVDATKRLSDFSDEEMHELLYGKQRKIKLKTPSYELNTKYDGVINKFTYLYITRDISAMSAKTQSMVARFVKREACPGCHGARLNTETLSCKINGLSIAEAAALEADQLVTFLTSITGEVAKPLVRDLTDRLTHLIDIGLGYLSLERSTDTLSGGESQRIKIVKNLSGGLVDVMYIFDEPSVGLHPRDVHRMNELLVKLRDRGNTVIVVEHDPDVIKIADHIIDMGPGAGSKGGMVVFEGSYKGLLTSSTVTGDYLQKPTHIKTVPRTPNGELYIKNACQNNLKNVSVAIPKNVLTVITGVAGSGKSSLIHGAFLQQHKGAIVIDQTGVGGSYRSNPATYTGAMDIIRQLFAKANGVSASLFSFNSKGACDTCHGTGIIYTDLGAMEGVKIVCEVCGGKRFKEDVLAYKLKDISIADVLDMTIDDAADFFDEAKLGRILQTLQDVGVGYLSLGQSLDTLSGGECQRVKLGSELHKKGSVYVLDEPTTGLHASDIAVLQKTIDHLVDNGNTVIVIEHNTDIIRRADWVIDMGPEAGSKGGEILFEGLVRDLKTSERSMTAKFI